MPCLVIKYNPAVGPIVEVGAGPAGAFQKPQIPATDTVTFPALIDTGASITCVSPEVAQRLRLNPIGMRDMNSATHTVPVNVYLVDLFLPFGATAYVVRGTQVMEFSPGQGSPYQILLGRDIICRGVLTMSFDGHLTLSL